MAQATKRLGVVALLYGAVYLLYLLVPDTPVTEAAYPATVTGIFVAISVTFFLLIRYGGLAPALLIDLGLLFEIVGAVGIEIPILWWPGAWWEGADSIWVNGVSWTCVWVMMFPLLVPASPGKATLAALAAASVRPLMLIAAVARGAPAPDSVGVAIMWIGPAYVCVAIAWVASYVMHRMGAAVTKAERMGRYRLVDRLGEGGMGEVWRAEHELLARPAAVKFIRPGMLAGSGEGGQALVRRFQREAQATASLASPHTVELYDFGLADDGTFYYVMEMLKGLDLRALVERFGPVPPGRTAYLLRQVCESLAEAHEIGLVHRDIKPANIHVCRSGVRHDFVKVLDFGLVKHTTTAGVRETALTAENVAAGTPQFMAPEMALGEPIDGRADLYAVGCTAYWMLTGQYVFDRASAIQLVMDHVRSEPTRPSQRTELPIPPAMEELVMACLAKDPAERPRDALVLRARLAEIDGDRWDQNQAAEWWSAHLPDLVERGVTEPSGESPTARC